jgi:4-hydroxy-2-oxoheptanedioate aldolase
LGTCAGLIHRCQLSSSVMEGVEQTAERIRELGRRAVPVVCNMSEAEQIRAMFARLDGEYGRVDVLGNVAGEGALGDPEHIDLDQVQKVLQNLVIGRFCCCQEAARRMLAAGKGSIINIGSLASVTALGRGHIVYSFMMVDMQHGCWEFSEALLAFRAMHLGRSIPMARVRHNDFYAIGALLDRGALGIVVPMVNSVEEARAAAFAMRYPPRGGRSCGPVLATDLYGADYEQRINDEVFLAVQIETRQGLECVEDIMAVDGVDGCWVGPGDLCKSLGIDANSESGAAALDTALQRVMAACRASGKIPGIWGGDDAQVWIDRGFLFVTTGFDAGVLKNGARQALRNLRQAAR